MVHTVAAACPTRRCAGEIRIALGREIELGATLEESPQSQGLILFAHGSGSSRFSVRNRCVAQSLRSAGFSTLLIDLLTTREDQIDALTRELRFDIALLTRRLIGVIDYFDTQNHLQGLPLGLFGASTGAAAALSAAAARPKRVNAIVSRGGRPDLASKALGGVQAPTLLIVGSDDLQMLQLNREALNRMTALVRLITVPGASHLFEEPGALEQVAHHAANWFTHYLGARHDRAPLS